MLFHEWRFLGLFAAVFVLFYSLPTRAWTWRKLVLLLASYAFYMSWNPPFVLLLLFSTAADYTLALAMHREKTDNRRRVAYLCLSLLCNLGVLAFFKYGGFLARNIGVLVALPPGAQQFLSSIVLPMGISFYTFQTLSYSIDVYRRRREPHQNLLEFALFVSFFPQLVAGPILRAGEFLPQLADPSRFLPENLRRGMARFAIGITKKMVLADTLGLFVDQVFAAPAEMSTVSLALSLYAFAFQIYFDFSGYTDMAIGVAEALGFKLVENFDHPYAASSITDFWRRWHMSLSRWLRDYLYFSLGGSRCSKLKTYRNLMITMLLGGLWHGAGWPFVIWGGFHGIILAVERALRGDARKQLLEGITLRRAVWVFITFQLVVASWFVFRVPDVPTAGAFLRALGTNGAPVSDAESRLILLCALLWAGHLLSHRFRLGARFVEARPVVQGLSFAAVIMLVASTSTTGVPFIYFQF